MAYTTLFPALRIGEPLRRKFIDNCIKKFYEKKPILPTYQLRKIIDVFYSRGEESIIARATRLLNIPAEISKLLTEIIGVTLNSNGALKELHKKIEIELTPIIVKNGKLTVLKNSSYLLHGTHQDWSDHRKIFDLILHSPTLISVEEIIKVAQSFTDHPRLLLKELHDNKIITLLGNGKETLIWKTGTPPPKTIISALREIRQKKLEVTTLQILQHQDLEEIKNSPLYERLVETLEILSKHQIIKEEKQYVIDQYSSISLEAAINEVTPLIQLYKFM